MWPPSQIQLFNKMAILAPRKPGTRSTAKIVSLKTALISPKRSTSQAILMIWLWTLPQLRLIRSGLNHLLFATHGPYSTLIMPTWAVYASKERSAILAILRHVTLIMIYLLTSSNHGVAAQNNQSNSGYQSWNHRRSKQIRYACKKFDISSDPLVGLQPSG